LWPLIGNFLMIGVGLAFIYLAISRGYEPFLLIPIGFGAILANVPYAGLAAPHGVLDTLRRSGIENELLPALMFVSIGAMCDFTSLIRRPMLLLFAAAGQLGIFVTLNVSLALGFTPFEASSIGIIGAMDGPTAIMVTQRLAPHLLGPVSVCAYSYMSLVPLLQRPLSKLLTTPEERRIRMEYASGELPRSVRVAFPIAVFLVSSLVAPQGALLMGCLMLGNLIRESGVARRLSEGAQNELANIVTLLLGLSIGGTHATHLRPRPRRLRLRHLLGHIIRKGDERSYRRQGQSPDRRLRCLGLPHGCEDGSRPRQGGGPGQLAPAPVPRHERGRADSLRGSRRSHSNLRPPRPLPSRDRLIQDL